MYKIQNVKTHKNIRPVKVSGDCEAPEGVTHFSFYNALAGLFYYGAGIKDSALLIRQPMIDEEQNTKCTIIQAGNVGRGIIINEIGMRIAGQL